MPREKKLSRSFGRENRDVVAVGLDGELLGDLGAVLAVRVEPDGRRRAGADGQRQVADEQLGLEVDGTRRVEAGLEGRAHGMSPFLGSGLMSVRAAQRTQPCTRLLEERLRPGAPGPNCGPGWHRREAGHRRPADAVAARTALTIHVLSDWPRPVASSSARTLRASGSRKRDARGLGALVVG